MKSKIERVLTLLITLGKRNALLLVTLSHCFDLDEDLDRQTQCHHHYQINPHYYL